MASFTEETSQVARPWIQQEFTVAVIIHRYPIMPAYAGIL